MLMSIRSSRVSLIGLVGAIALLPTRAAPLIAQSEECGGWMVSCASVQVHADGEQLVFYVPNATAPTDLRREAGVEADERLRVYTDLDGMACDPATGEGCVDITDPWLQVADSGSSDADGGVAESGALDPGNRSCDEDVDWLDSARGLREEDRPRCGRPVAAYFIVALPAAAFLFAPDGDEPDVVLPIGEDPGVLGGDGADDGSSGSDGASGDGGSTGGTGSGGSDEGGSSGGAGSGGSDDGGSSGGEGGGDTGGGALPGGGGLPPRVGGGGTPGMGEVPEPISTTLYSIGLLGYAGARLRRRRADDGPEEDA